jgi:molecular chaperone DnaK
MVKDAELHAADDKKRKGVIEARNHADSLIHTTERTLSENADKVGADDKTKIEAAIADLRGVMDSDDAETIKSKTEVLAQAAMKLGEAMYKAQAGAGGPGEDAGPGQAGGAQPGAGAGGGGREGVVDADFEEVDEERKNRSA